MLNYIETHIVDHCNLKCKGCSHFSCLVEDPTYKNFDDYVREMLELKRNMDVGIIRIMGGEPLLHPRVKEFVKATREIFPQSQISLVTNGILLREQDNKFFDILNDNKIILSVSGYTINIKKDKWVNKIDSKLLQVVDKSQLYNISLDLTGKQDPQESFNKCDLSSNRWNFFKDGRIYHCCVMANIEVFEDYFHLSLGQRDLDDISIPVSAGEDAVQEFLSKPMDICKFCDIDARAHSYSDFQVTKKKLDEWTANGPDISLIIPAHNLENYIMPLLYCLRAQKKGKYEYEFVFVCDNCDDGTEQKIKEMMSGQNVNLKILSGQAGSCGRARNAGLNYAEGKYIWFVDADDWLMREDAIEIAVEQMKSIEDKIDYLRVGFASDVYKRENREMVWQYIFKREIFDEFRFGDTFIDEDKHFMDRLLNSDYKSAYLEGPPLYYYNYLRPGSNMYNYYLKNDLMQEALDIEKRYEEEHNKE